MEAIGLRRHGGRRDGPHRLLPREAGRPARHARTTRTWRWPAWASMSSRPHFLYRRSCRRDAADPDSSRDFGKDIIPYLVKHGKAVAHRFAELLRPLRPPRPRPIGATSARSTPTGRPTSTSPTSVPALDLYDQDWPIWTYGEITPPAKFVHDEEGRRGDGRQLARVRRLHRFRRARSGSSLLFTGVRVHSYATSRTR